MSERRAAHGRRASTEDSTDQECAFPLQVPNRSTMHNGPAVNQDAPVVKIFHVNQEVATGAYCPKLEFENPKKQYFSWLLRSEHIKTNIFGNLMTKLTI